MKKGEIWIVEIPGLGGHEQEGRRPCIILADTSTSVSVILPCTANLQALRFPYTVRLDASRKNGLAATSVALILQLRAIDKKRLLRRIGILEKSYLEEIGLVLKKLLLL